ncbi:MAG: biopolymer transporter ExbD [Verrucomicrobiales bacterium]|nr:biopolymer transporter ExbD [Verrucomicrobiales bacterium]
MHDPHQSKHRGLEVESVNLGFQIAPMIDVVFVIMLFFMVMAGAVKVEHELKTSLPGVAPPMDNSPEMPDEVIVAVEEGGAVLLNEEEFDSPQSKTLPDFTATLTRLKMEADNRDAKVLVTIEAEEEARYERVIDVLNALAKARISNVTFTVGSEDFF